MVPVYEIKDEAEKLIGVNRPEFFYRRLTDAVELLANKGDFDPTTGYLDICTNCERLVSLPREVETVTSLNMAGVPAVARDMVFQFHLNGPGQMGPDLTWTWFDYGQSCLYREMKQPAKLIGFCSVDADENSELWAYGYDAQNNWITTTNEDGSVTDGWQVPVFKVMHALPADAPVFSRVVRVRKGLTKGPVRLSTIDNSGATGVLLGVYQWDELEPSFRRIKLSQKVEWVRIGFRKRIFKVTNDFDLLPVNNSQAVIMMLRALKLYDDEKFGDAEAAESTAVRWIVEEQHSSAAAVVQPIQVQDANPLNDPCDHLD